MSATTVRSASRVRACFDLARAGNFPSVLSNVLAALVLSAGAGPALPDIRRFALCGLAGFLTYAGGATLNDVADAAFDSVNSPERPIPRRVLTRSTAAAIGAFEMILGLGLLVGAGAGAGSAVALAATIVIYDWIHKSWSGSVVLMAGCRVLLAVTLSTLPGQGRAIAFWCWVGGLFAYIVTLSVIARREYRSRMAVAPSSSETGQRSAAKGGFPIRRLLAFIPLVDAVALVLVGAWLPALVCAAAVPAGRWAQRLAASS